MEENLIDDVFAPEHLRINIGDFVLFFAEEDEEEALDFLENVLEKANEACHEIVGYPFNDLEMSNRELEAIESLCKVSVQKWFYVTENFIVNKKMRAHKDEQLMNAIMKGDAFVPVWSKPKSEFVDLPYGLMSYQGLYKDDPRLIKKLLIWFKRQQHRSKKEEMSIKQKNERVNWLKLEKEKREKEEKVRQEYQKKREEALDPEVREAIQKEGLQSIHCQLKIIHDLLKKLPEKIYTAQKESQEERDMPEYLLRSLSIARGEGSVSPRSGSNSSPLHIGSNNDGKNVTYNITINQPGKVVLPNKVEDETVLNGVSFDQVTVDYERGNTSSPDSFEMIDGAANVKN